MISSKKTKIASLDITQMPNVYKKIYDDLMQFDEPIDYIEKRGNVYFKKIYQIDLYGWSGLQRFYNNLEKIKKLKQHDDIAVINRVVLNPNLCVRILSDQQAKQYWQKDFHYRTSKGIPFEIMVMVCDDVSQAKGFYDQKEAILFIKNDSLKEMRFVLKHQFVHVLDHITAMVFKRNCDKLIENADFTIGKSDKLIKTPNKKHQSVDLWDVYNKEKQQYSASFAQIVDMIQQDFIKDLWQFSYHYGVKTELFNVLFSYITSFNILTKTIIPNKKIIMNKLKQIQTEDFLCYDLFDFIIKNNSSDVIDALGGVRMKGEYNYAGIIKDMYQQIKHDRYISELNEVQKQILSSI